MVYVGLAGSPSMLDTRALALADVTAVGILVVPRLVPAGRSRPALAIVIACLGVSILGIGMLEGALLAMSVAVYGFLRIVATTIIFLILMATPEVGSRHIGAVTGGFFSTAEIGGFGGPFLIGALLEWTNSFVPGLAFSGGTRAIAISWPK